MPTEEKQEEAKAPETDASVVELKKKYEELERHARNKEEEAARVQKKLEAFEKANIENEVKRLKETEDYKGLYEKAEKELAEIKPRAAIAEESEKTLRSVLDSQIAELPESMRGLVPDELSTQQKLQWLSKNKALLVKPKPVDIGAGKQGGGAPVGVELTQEEIQIAKSFGMSPEDYAKHKIK